MAKLEKHVQKFVKSYSINDVIAWKVSVSDGHGGQIRKQGFPTKEDALEYALKKYSLVLSQDKCLRSAQSQLTFSQYSAEWIEFKRRNGLSEATAMRYDEHVKIRLNDFFGPYKLVELEKFHLRNFISEMQSKGLSTSLIKHSVTTFKSIIKQAEIDDLIPTKGILMVPTPRHKNKEPDFLDPMQMKFFLNATRSSKYNRLWTFALYTGMRAGEIAGLKWDCVHLNKNIGDYRGAIEVKRSYNQKTLSIQETTKNGDRRIVPILPEAREVLLELQKESNGEFVFGGAKHLNSSHFSRMLKSEMASLTNLPQIQFHKLRHSFCSYLDSKGLPRRIVSEIMGHRDLSTTDKYSHVSENVLGNEISRWLRNQNQQKANNLMTVNF